MNFCPNCATAVEPNQTHCIECNFDLRTVSQGNNNSNQEILKDHVQSHPYQYSTSQDSRDSAAILGLVLAITGWFLPVPIIDSMIALIGVGLSIRGLNSSRKGIAITGIVVGIIAAIGSLLFWSGF